MSKMVRKGECNKCGLCCMHAGWFSIWADPQMLEYLRARHSDMRIEEYPESRCPEYPERHEINILVPNRCQHLVDRGHGISTCAIHGDTKPELCKVHPTAPDTLWPGCGFWFEEAGDCE